MKNAGKGDRRRSFNYKMYIENYDKIVWELTCYNCGAGISKEQMIKNPHLYILYDDGNVEHKNCNFN